MTLLERYLNYLSQICEGSRKAPDGITLTKTGDMEKAIEVLTEVKESIINAYAAKSGLSHPPCAVQLCGKPSVHRG